MHLLKEKVVLKLIPPGLFCISLLLTSCADQNTAELTQPDPGLNAEASSAEMEHVKKK